MDRNFALLGLREDATKEQVKEAYGRRLAKYKSADYADDPEYVKRKIADLNEAYTKAYNRAGGGMGGAAKPAENAGRGFHDAEKAGSTHRKVKEQRYAQKRREMEDEEFHPLQKLKMEKSQQEEGEGRQAFRKPDLSSLKTKAEEFRDNIKENFKENLGGTEETGETDVPPPSIGDAAQSSRKKDTAYSEVDGSAGKIIVVVFVAIIMLVTAMCDGSDTTNYYDEDWDSSYYSSDYNDEDWEIANMAESVRSVIFEELEIADDIVEIEDDEEKLRRAADQFAQHYTGCDTIADLCGDLYMRAGAFSASEGDDAFYQVDEVLRYYEFPALEDVIGYINPYTGKSIKNRTGYLRYLNRYYEEEQAS